ncbi:hypothetical protein, partial [Siminovitchia fortis]|uniref:hypothetical protein n=1 Tax=Siminovitchia fortis TaxID=254758 RepID=UPI001C92F34E
MEWMRLINLCIEGYKMLVDVEDLDIFMNEGVTGGVVGVENGIDFVNWPVDMMIYKNIMIDSCE